MGLEVPEPPALSEGATELLATFQRLSARRPEGFSGPQKIPIESIYAWSKLTGKRIGEAVLDALLNFDDAWHDELKRAREHFKEREKQK